MKEWQEARKGALTVEEAALLPALPRPSLGGGAALKNARQKAEAMGRMTLGEERSWGEGEKAERSAVRRSVSRAALHHVMNRMKK